MTFLQKLSENWKEDRLFRRVIRNSGYLFSSNSISAILSFIQGILATRLLGVDGYGLVSGIVIVFVTNINRLLSFRMSEVVVRHLGEAQVNGDKERAGAVVKGAALSEAITSILAYIILLILSPLAARYLAKDTTTTPLFVIYGVILLSNIVFETSTGVLQATRRFDQLAKINLLQTILTALLILGAFFAKLGALEILLAYVAGKTFAGVAVALSARKQLDLEIGRNWIRAPLARLKDWRSIARFAISTNLSGTVNLLVRDSETLLIAFFMTTTEAGYFRLALGLITLLVLPMDPLIAPTYTEINSTIAQQEWSVTRRLLKQVSSITGLWTLVAGGGLALLGWWLIPLAYGADAAPTYPILLILLIGYGFANILQWNRHLLLSMGMATFPLIVAALVGLVKTGLTIGLVPAYGPLAEAGILSAYFILSIAILAGKGLNTLKLKEKEARA